MNPKTLKNILKNAEKSSQSLELLVGGSIWQIWPTATRLTPNRSGSYVLRVDGKFRIGEAQRKGTILLDPNLINGVVITAPKATTSGRRPVDWDTDTEETDDN